MRENVQQGWRAGGRAPIGYKLEKTVVGTRDGEPITKSRLVPDPKTFDKIQAYLRGRLNNVARKHLIRELGIMSAATTMIYVEESALTYAGHTVWNRHNESIDGRYVGGSRYRDRKEWIIQRNTHQAMISDEEAETLISRREKERASRKRKRITPYLLSGIIRCRCGANMDGAGGYYRCHARCGNRGIKQETVEQAVIEILFDKIMSPEAIRDLRETIQSEIGRNHKSSDSASKRLKKAISQVDKQVEEIINLLQQVKHQRPLLAKLDQLEEERSALLEQLEKTRPQSSGILDMSDTAIINFLKKYRNDFKKADIEKRKGIIRSCISYAELNGDELKINPSYANITEVKVASPRGFEPLLPP